MACAKKFSGKMKNRAAGKIMRNHLAKHLFPHFVLPVGGAFSCRRLWGKKSLGLGVASQEGLSSVGLFPLKTESEVTQSCPNSSLTPWTVAHRLLCPWDSPGKNTGVGCHFFLQVIFLTQGSNPGLLHCRQTL